jgi:citronellyl-CoA synthetase
VSTTEVENVLGAWPGVEDAVVYGVEVPGADGRCGMAALRLLAGTRFDANGLATHLRQHLPPYAVPLFVRLLNEVETTGTFKYKKTELKRQAYDPAQTADPLFILLPDAPGFQALDAARHAALSRGDYRL